MLALRPSLLLLFLLSPSAAGAVTVTRFELRDGDRLLGPGELQTYLNAARCTCSSKIKLCAAELRSA